MDSQREVTNKFGWPQEVYRVITRDRYYDPTEKPSDYSVTKLINPVQQTTLLRRYPDKQKVQDVSGLFWSFLGHMAHSIIEDEWKHSEGVKSEERLYMDIEGVTISGKIDCYLDGEIRDYKTTKCYKVIKGDYTDWSAQLNMYRLLLEHNGFPVTSMKIIAILFDWKESESYKKGYPASQVVEIPIKVWSKDEAYQYLTKRVKALLKAATLSDSELAKQFPCSDHDRWEDILCYQLFKKGSTRATKNFDTQAEAINHCCSMPAGDYSVQPKKSGPRRCLKHCQAAPSCLQFQSYLKQRESK